MIDADIEGYFDNVDHGKIVDCLRQRIEKSRMRENSTYGSVRGCGCRKAASTLFDIILDYCPPANTDCTECGHYKSNGISITGRSIPGNKGKI